MKNQQSKTVRKSAVKSFGICVLVLLVACGATFAQQQPTAPVTNSAESTQAKPETQELHLDAGDLLEVSVFGIPELTQQVRINSSGDASFALLGAVRIGGLTLDAAQALLERQLREKDLVKDPNVSIMVKEYATQGVSVLGEVTKPGIYSLLGPRRLFDVVSAAGGLTAKAGRTISITRRASPDQPINVNFTEDLASSMESNVRVYPGDTVVVSKAGVVYVVGDVGQPGGFVMENNSNLSVLQAIALARGANHTAALKGAKIIRRSPEGLKEVPIPLDKILSAQAPDLPLRAEDIVFVPNSAVKSAAKRGLESIIQVATGVAIYRR